MSLPDWVPEAIFYQIFPDRFATGRGKRPQTGCVEWGSKPTAHGFQGGTLAGITRQLDYLLDLGVNAVYLNPIFLATSNHRYNTYDYYQIDYRLGTRKDFQTLLRRAHQKGIRIVLDGVFNHCGRGFFAFNDLLENQRESRYRNWFHVLRYPVEAYAENSQHTYKSWWNIKSLPKFNTSEPEVRAYLLGVARYWIEQGIDGWRLDVPNEIDDDSFWAEFREQVQQANPSAFTFGEIWEVNPRWVDDQHFHGLMNYPVRQHVLDWLSGQIKAETFAHQIIRTYQAYPEGYRLGMYNLLGSHDRERLLTLLDSNLEKAMLGYQFLIAFPGVPSIYYGDEVGMLGGKDPDCRGAFPWRQEAWNIGLRLAIQKLIAVRKSTPALQRGDLRVLFADNANGVCAFARAYRDQQVLLVFNASHQSCKIHLPLAGSGVRARTILRDLLSQGEWAAGENGVELNLTPHQAVWLIPVT